MSFDLHTAFVRDAGMVRDALNQAGQSNFELTISIDGRCASDADECKIEYQVSSGYSHTVKGDSVESCLSELLRRLGWTATHAPLALAPPRKSKATLAREANRARANGWDSIDS